MSLKNLLKYFTPSKNKISFIISSLFSGILHIFKVDDGTGIIKECSFSSLPNIDFQEKIFRNLDEYSIYDSNRYKQITSIFIEKFYPKTLIEHKTLEYRSRYKNSILNGRYDYLETIWRVIDEMAPETITQEYFDSLPNKYGYKSKDAFLFHSNQIAKLDYRNRLFHKGTSKESDLILPFRDMISKNLRSCTLEVGTKSDNMFLNDLSVVLSREYLGDDLNKYVPMTDFYAHNFINYPEIKDLWDSIYKIENIWNKIEGPILDLKNYLEKELGNVVFNGESEAFLDDEFDVSFYVASSSGIDTSSTLKRRFSTKKWTETSVTFKRADLSKYI